MLEKMESSLFDWQTWRAGGLTELVKLCRFDNIIRNREIIKKYAVGWCRGESVPCRAKNEIAVMYFKEGRHFWSHLRTKEFNIIFEEDL